MSILPILRLFRLGRDGYAAAAAAIGVILLGVIDGVALAVVLSILALLRRLSNPYVARLGRISDGHDFVDIRHHPTAREIPDVAIWRPAEPLFFANAEAILGQIASSVATNGHGAVVLSLEESIDFDSTAVDALLEFDSTLTDGGKLALYARVHDRVRKLIASERPGIGDRCCFSVDDAVTSIRTKVSQNPPIMAGQTTRSAATRSFDDTINLDTIDLLHPHPPLATAHLVKKRKPS
jgi:MFS superfamily sulfate permease-like transporter